MEVEVVNGRKRRVRKVGMFVAIMIDRNVKMRRKTARGEIDSLTM